ncbi:hypothetical protein WDU94_008886 [Cyamophila willieti]
MNEMTRHFQEAFAQTDQFFHGSPLLDSFFGQNNGQNQIPTILPPPAPAEENVGSLRDKCLKPDGGKQLKEYQKQSVADSDLDKEFKNGQISLFKSNQEPSSSIQMYTPRNNEPRVFSSQVFTRVVRRPDGVSPQKEEFSRKKSY